LFIVDEAIAVLVPISNLQPEHSNFQKMLEIFKNLVNGRRTRPNACGHFIEGKIKSVLEPKSFDTVNWNLINMLPTAVRIYRLSPSIYLNGSSSR
jgi:hypothetical protein